MTDTAIARAFRLAEEKAHDFRGLGMVGFGVAHLLDERGRTKELIPFANLISTAGDQYYAQKGVVGIAPASPSAPTAVNGMKLGTGTTAAAKSGAGAALATYLSGSNQPFATGYPTAAAYTGTDTGWTANYQSIWAAGTATSATINEAAIVNDQATNATSSAANSISRVVFGSTINKGSSDALTVTWSHRFLGA